jgi:superfamily II DNA/RNA helicase
MTREMMVDPVTLDTVGLGAAQAATTVQHKAVIVPRRDTHRAALLEDVIVSELAESAAAAAVVAEATGLDPLSPSAAPSGRVIVFTETKRECDEVSSSDYVPHKEIAA